MTRQLQQLKQGQVKLKLKQSLDGDNKQLLQASEHFSASQINHQTATVVSGDTKAPLGVVYALIVVRGAHELKSGAEKAALFRRGRVATYTSNVRALAPRPCVNFPWAGCDGFDRACCAKYLT